MIRKMKLFYGAVLVLGVLVPLRSLPSFGSLDYAPSENRKMNATLVQEWLEDDWDPPVTPGAFLHIGKTGGSTLAAYLRNGCHSWTAKPCNPNISHETRLSLWTTYYHVPDFGKLHQQQYQFYAVTLRDPFARTRSSFSFFHEDNFWAMRNAGSGDWRIYMWERKQFSRCFPTFQDFATILQIVLTRRYKDTSETVKPCYKLTAAVWKHRQMYAEHLYWDMRHVQQILANYTTIWDEEEDRPFLLALRTEHLWDDWVSANQVLGQEHVVVPPNATKLRDYSHIQLPVLMNLTEDGQRSICWALRKEYRAYFRFLLGARNLQASDRRASLEESRQNCPWLFS